MSHYDWAAEFQKLLKRRAVTAVIAANDDYALRALAAVKEIGLSVPADISIIGMDDIPDAASHGLTTLRFSCEEVGRCAVEAVVRMITGEKSRACSRVLPVQMIERSSVAPLTEPKNLKRKLKT